MSKQPSDTPRTDAMFDTQPMNVMWWPDFARQLERELNEAKALEKDYIKAVELERDMLRTEVEKANEQLSKRKDEVLSCYEDWRKLLDLAADLIPDGTLPHCTDEIRAYIERLRKTNDGLGAQLNQLRDAEQRCDQWREQALKWQELSKKQGDALETADQWREVAELAIRGCKDVISPIRPRWKETMMRCADALAAYERLAKGSIP